MMLLADLVQRATGLRKFSRRDRKPRNESKIVLLTVFQRFLMPAIAQVVLVLHADNLSRLLP